MYAFLLQKMDKELKVSIQENLDSNPSFDPYQLWYLNLKI